MNLLSLLALSTALLHLWAEYPGVEYTRIEHRRRRWLTYLAKPLTTTLILILAFMAPAPVSATYQRAILIGLVFALAGDIFLMLPSDRFIPGLVSFLITHICYIVAFATHTQWPYWSPWALILVIYAVTIYGLLQSHLAKLRLPVLIYMGAIMVMAWLGITLAMQQGLDWAIGAGVGSLLFVISDSLLALNRFRRPFAVAQLLVLSTYYAAQWLIAWSVYGY